MCSGGPGIVDQDILTTRYELSPDPTTLTLHQMWTIRQPGTDETYPDEGRAIVVDGATGDVFCGGYTAPFQPTFGTDFLTLRLTGP